VTAYQHDVPGGAGWALTVPKDHDLHLECLGDGANVSMLLYAARDPLERLNVPDTLKAQMSARVAPPMVLMSDLGRALVSVSASSLDWHDAICGHSVDVSRFGPSSYAADGNDWRRSARELLLDELATLGLGRRDLHASVNWFSKVAPDESTVLSFVEDHARAGDWVRLRAEQDVLAVLATVPHPLDPAQTWAPAGIRVTVSPSAAPADTSRAFRPESARALVAAGRDT
jgi:urea carboxylase-associated protein 2